MANPNPTPQPMPSVGRPKGSLNKVSREAKEVIAAAAEELGGTARLVEWARASAANERAFWSNIYPRLLPHTIAGDPNAPIGVWQASEADVARARAVVERAMQARIDQALRNHLASADAAGGAP